MTLSAAVGHPGRPGEALVLAHGVVSADNRRVNDSRVANIEESINTLKRVVRGGSAADPALVQELIAARRSDDPLDAR